MDSLSHHLFASFRLDPANEQLWRDDKEIVLRRKTFEVLRFLVEHPGQLATKEALLNAVWTDVSVVNLFPNLYCRATSRTRGRSQNT